MKFPISFGMILLLLTWVPLLRGATPGENPAVVNSVRQPAAATVSGQSSAAPRILLINSRPFADPWSRTLFDRLKMVLAERGQHAVIDYLELNSAANTPAEYAVLSQPFLDAARRGRYDLVIALLDDAVRLLADHAAMLPPELPIIAYAREAPLPEFRERHANATGIVGQSQLERVIAAGQNLMPHADNILVLTDSANDCRRLLERKKSEFGHINLIVLDIANYRESELRELRSRLPENGFAVLAVNRGGGEGAELLPPETLIKLCKPDQTPVLVLDEPLLESGAIGGAVAPGSENGYQLADMAIRVLKAGNAAAIVPIPEKYQLIFDMNALRRHGLSGGYIPSGTFRQQLPPHQPWSGHDFWLAVSAISFGIMTLLLLAVYRCYWKKYQQLRKWCGKMPLELRFFAPNGGEKMRHGNLNGYLSEPEQAALRRWQTREHDAHKLQTGPVTRSCKFTDCTALLYSDNLTKGVERMEALILLPRDSGIGTELADTEYQAALQLWEKIALPAAIGNVTDPGRISWCNDAFSELTGIPRDELVDRHRVDLHWHVLPDYYPLRGDRDTPSGQIQFDTLVEYRGADGSIRIFRMAQIPLKLRDRTEFQAEVYDEITAGYFRNSQQSELIAQLNGQIRDIHLINQCLARITTENRIERSVNDLLRVLAVNLGADRCAIFGYTPDYRHANNVYEFTATGIPAERPVMQNIDIDRNHPGYYESLAQHVDIKVDDVALPPENLATAMAAVRRRGVQSMLLSGIWFHDHLWGFIVLEYVKNKHKFTDDNLRLLHDARNLFVLAQEKSRHYRALHDQAILYEQLFDSIDVAVTVFDAAKSVVLANRKSREMVHHELTGGKCYDYFCCYANTKFCGGAKCPLNAVIATHRNFRDIVRYEGNVYQLLAQPILSPSGALLYIIISLSGLEGVLSADTAADLPSWPAAAPETTTAVKPLHPIRNILLVDDAEAHLKIATGMLKSMGYAVTGTADGATALKLFATESFDAVLTDLWMPGMSGEMLARALRKCPGGMECRIYAITADPDTAGDFDAEYFDGMTTKPLTIGALRHLLSN